MSRNRIRRWVRTFLVVGMAWGAASVSPRAATAQADGTLLKSDLVRMMTGDSYSAEEVLQIVRMNCVGFTPSERDRKDLSRLFDGDELVNEIDRCRESGQSAGYRRGLPVAKKVSQVASVSPRPEDPQVGSPVLSGGSMLRPALDAPPVRADAPSDTMPGVLPSVPPKLLNWDSVSRHILSEYRPDERRSGSVLLKIWVDEDGRASNPSVVEATGDPALVEVARAAVPMMKFTPAESRGRRVGAWSTLPVRFETD